MPNAKSIARDRDVRHALHRKVFKEHLGDADTLVLNELGLRHGSCRVDIAVVNGYLHGYEIKSDADTLERLPNQVAIYSAVLDHATLIVSDKHADQAQRILPDWWGITVLTTGPRGGIEFKSQRLAAMNPAINPIALAELLWRPEVIGILQEMGTPAALLRKPRSTLYRYLAETLELDDLRDTVRRCLKGRAKWRDQLSASSNAGLLKPTPTL